MNKAYILRFKGINELLSNTRPEAMELIETEDIKSEIFYFTRNDKKDYNGNCYKLETEEQSYLNAKDKERVINHYFNKITDEMEEMKNSNIDPFNELLRIGIDKDQARDMAELITYRIDKEGTNGKFKRY